jgi:hypothetical protein
VLTPPQATATDLDPLLGALARDAASTRSRRSGAAFPHGQHRQGPPGGSPAAPPRKVVASGAPAAAPARRHRCAGHPATDPVPWTRAKPCSPAARDRLSYPPLIFRSTPAMGSSPAPPHRPRAVRVPCSHDPSGRHAAPRPCLDRRCENRRRTARNRLTCDGLVGILKMCFGTPGVVAIAAGSTTAKPPGKVPRGAATRDLFFVPAPASTRTGAGGTCALSGSLASTSRQRRSA